MFAKKTTLQSDWYTLLGVVATLVAIGLIFVYSSSSVYASEQFGSAHYYLKKHTLGILVGIVAFYVARFFSLEFLYSYAPLLFAGGFFLTLATLIPSIGVTIHGSSRWLSLPGLLFQPSEVLKVAFILYIARLITKQHGKPFTFKRSYLPVIALIAITAAVLLKQPDFGLTITLSLTAFMLLFIAGLPLTYLAATAITCIPAFILLIYMFPYRLARIMTFLDPWKDPQGAGFQIIQSLIAIGSGSWLGSGIAHSKQKFFYLPMQHTDFIFSIIAEETGFIGVSLIILLYVLLLYKGIKIAWQLRTPFALNMVLGCTLLITLQTIINIFVATGLFPTKGIGLPLISYGNTSLVCTLFMIGLIANAVDHGK